MTSFDGTGPAQSRALRFLLLLISIVVSLSVPAYGQQTDIETLQRRASELYGAGKTREAVPLVNRILELQQKFLPAEHAEIATTLNMLGALYHAEGRHAEAASQFARALQIREKVFAAVPPPADKTQTSRMIYQMQHSMVSAEVSLVLNNLASAYRAQGLLREAEPLFVRALRMREEALKGARMEGVDRSTPEGRMYFIVMGQVVDKREAEVAQSLNNLADLYEGQDRLAEAEPLFARALATYEKVLPPESPLIALSVRNLAGLYVARGQFAKAEPLFKRSLELYEKALPAGHPDIASVLANLASLYEHQGRFAEGVPLAMRALEIQEHALSALHPDSALTLHLLGTLYQGLGRSDDAEVFFKRALAIREKAFPDGHPELAHSLGKLALLYKQTNRTVQAEALARRAVEMSEKVLPPGHRGIGTNLDMLAGLYQQQGQLEKAESFYKRSLTIYEKALPPGHPDTATVLNNLAYVYQIQKRFTEAEALARRALGAYEKALPAGHPDINMALSNLAGVQLEQGQPSAALQTIRRATNTLTSRTFVHSEPANAGLFISSNTWFFRNHVRSAWRVAEKDQRQGAKLADEAFRMAQWSERSSAAAALTQMAARLGSGVGPLAVLVRERQDLADKRKIADQRLIQLIGSTDADVGTARQTVAALEARLAEIDQSLRRDFPNYAALVVPPALGISDVQRLLAADEALLVFLDVPRLGTIESETFGWLITVDAVRWKKLATGPEEIGRQIQALRCGLDREGEWPWSVEQQRWVPRRAQCNEMKPAGLARDELPPFDFSRAYSIYSLLLAPFADVGRDKHLIIVPSGPLASLPFAALLTEAVNPLLKGAAAYREAPWLGLRQSMSLLPSVTSLAALRNLAKRAEATKPFIGFGNPLLTGNPKDAEHRRRAGVALTKQSCSTKPVDRSSIRVAAGPRGNARTVLRNGQVDIQAIREQLPLPETADELCSVARALGADEGDVYLGARASEANVKQASKVGTLARYRVVHFATHGLLAGETEWFVKGRAEPALILTPPDSNVADPENDGLLTASEISQLRLDADWVILSACNTAGADDLPGAEALSGLAKAFFYAGARALLVSHWAVDTEATTRLITGMFEELKAKKMNRTKALQRSTLLLIADQTQENAAHPSIWAPFVVVGDYAMMQ